MRDRKRLISPSRGEGDRRDGAAAGALRPLVACVNLWSNGHRIAWWTLLSRPLDLDAAVVPRLSRSHSDRDSTRLAFPLPREGEPTGPYPVTQAGERPYCSDHGRPFRRIRVLSARRDCDDATIRWQGDFSSRVVCRSRFHRGLATSTARISIQGKRPRRATLLLLGAETVPERDPHRAIR
jgi:hypothetical protein